MNLTTQKLYSLQEAADLLQYSTTQGVRKLIRTGKISPIVRHNARKIGIPESSMNAYLNTLLIHTDENQAGKPQKKKAIKS